LNAEAHRNEIISFDIAILRHKESCTTTQFFSTLPSKALKTLLSKLTENSVWQSGKYSA